MLYEKNHRLNWKNELSICNYPDIKRPLRERACVGPWTSSTMHYKNQTMNIEQTSWMMNVEQTSQMMTINSLTYAHINNKAIDA